MQQNTISFHQAGVLMGILILVLKLTSLPSLLYSGSEYEGVISIILICLIDFLIIFLITFFKKKYKNISFYDIFCNFLGNFLAKIFYFLFFIFFLFKLLALVDDGFGFIRDVADDEFTFFNFIICFFPVIVAISYSGIRNMSRTAEFFFPFILIGLFISIIFSFAPLNFFGLGSFSRINFLNIFEKLGKLSFWGGDIFPILIFAEKIDFNKGKIRHMFYPVIFVAIFLISAYTMYYSLYQETAILHSNMIFDIVEYTIGTSSGWHMDIFAIIVYITCLYLQGAIYFYCLVKILEKIFNFKNIYIIYASIIACLIIVQFLYLNDYLKYVVFAINYLSIFSIIFIFLIVFLLIFTILLKGSKNERSFRKNKNII